MEFIATLAVSDLSEPSLWGIVIVLAGVIARGGFIVFKRLTDCEDDRELLHRKCGKLATAYAANTGEVIDLDDVT